MRQRGQKFWDWSKEQLHVRDHDERLSDGTSINIQVRHSPAQGVQLFVGVYAANNAMLFEEIYESRVGETMTQAAEWGASRAHAFIDSQPGGVRRTAGMKPESLPRKGSSSYKG
jgi:hypothetical protein